MRKYNGIYNPLTITSFNEKYRNCVIRRNTYYNYIIEISTPGGWFKGAYCEFKK